MMKDRLAEIRRDTIKRPVIFVGTGTCGLGRPGRENNGGGSQLPDHNSVQADIVEVGCIVYVQPSRFLTCSFQANAGIF